MYWKVYCAGPHSTLLNSTLFTLLVLRKNQHCIQSSYVVVVSVFIIIISFLIFFSFFSSSSYASLLCLNLLLFSLSLFFTLTLLQKKKNQMIRGIHKNWRGAIKRKQNSQNRQWFYDDWFDFFFSSLHFLNYESFQ